MRTSSTTTNRHAGRTRWHRLVAATLAAVAVLALPAFDAAAQPAAPATAAAPAGPLIDVEGLQRLLQHQRRDVVLLDASPRPMYAAGRIPGALHVDVFADGVRQVGPAEMERRLQGWGISPGTKVVVYDQGGSYLAPRLYYDLYLHGLPPADLLLLDGGMAKWRAGGGTVTKEPTPAPAKGSFRVGRLVEEARTTLPEFLAATGDPRRHAVVEALEPSWHFGQTAWFDRAGHVPNAIMMPSPDFFAADKTFKPRAELKRMASYLGIRPEQQVTTYCGGGIAAATPFFAFRFLLDHPKVKLYAGSQFEWLQDDRGLPMWTYSAPNLMRETPWVKAWTSKMMHAVGAVRVSLVDVRPAAAYQAAHLPFSLNVPAEVFRAHLDEPDKLAQLLGQAGVNPAFEAVVVSEAGLDADAALAYLALERLGQRRVSVFMDTLERWAELGQEVAREPTVVGEAKKPGDVPVPRSAYAPAPRSGFVLGEAAGGASSLYPKVFVAMGAKAPANTAERTWVHLPAKSLLQADGRPLAAKDLWAAISKAGVPRYAEIVLAGDAPGEAAMGHFLFRLLGFPDVKVVAP